MKFRRLIVPALGVGIAVLVGVFVLTPPAPSNTTTSATLTATQTSTPLSPSLSRGRTLFDETCSTCHGIDAQGSALAPNLRGLGAGTVDLWVSSGWMPLAQPTSQPIKKPALFDRSDTEDIANYVASLAPGGVPIQSVDLSGASVSDGFSLFSLNCAPCHTITGAGDALSNGISAPPLHGITTTEIAEAIRTGPGNMPRFGPGTLSNSQLRDVVAYVREYIQHPRNPGGLGLGGVGPVAEGFIGLFAGVGICVLFALWIGERTERDEDAGGREGHDGQAGEPAHA